MGQSSTTAASQSEALASKDSKIVIIGGGGTMGSSTALHLSRRGFTDIRIMDVYPIPSSNSAGNDLNKIAGDDQIGTYEGVADTLWDAWNTDPVFKPYVHLVGKLELTVDETEAKFLKAKVDRMRARGRTDVEWLDNEEDVRRRAPHLKNADIKVSSFHCTINLSSS